MKLPLEIQSVHKSWHSTHILNLKRNLLAKTEDLNQIKSVKIEYSSVQNITENHLPYQELEKSQSEHEKTLTDVYTDMIQLLKFSDKDKSMIIKN